MAAAHRIESAAFANVWAATWLPSAPYRRLGLPGRVLTALVRSCRALRRRQDADTDYFSRLANLPDLPQRYKVLALAIVMHQRKEAALRRLIVADEV